MKNLTTPQAILGGLALIALAIASIPYSSNIVTSAHADSHKGIKRVAICSTDGVMCATIKSLNNSLFYGELAVSSRSSR